MFVDIIFMRVYTYMWIEIIFENRRKKSTVLFSFGKVGRCLKIWDGRRFFYCIFFRRVWVLLYYLYILIF